MSGFPVRPSRTAFGPTYSDAFPVTDPSKELGASVVNLVMWQLAACGLVLPQATIFVDASGSGATTTTQYLAWDPSQALSLLAWVRTGAGVYTCQLAPTYTDMDGNSVATNLKPGKAWVTEANDKSSAFAKMLDPTKVEVRTYNAAGSAADLDFGLNLH